MTRLLEASQKFVGTEPSFKGFDFTTMSQEDIKLLIIRSLNWYAAESNLKESMTWLQKDYPDKKFSSCGTAGFLCRMVKRGFPDSLLRPRIEQMVESRTQKEKKADPVSPVVDKPVKVYDSVDPSVDKVCEIVDYAIDDFLMKRTVSHKISLSGLNRKQISAVKEYVLKQLTEYTGCNKREGYDNIGVRMENAIVGWLSKVMQELNSIENVRAERKPRKKKEVPVEKIVRGYLFSDFNEYKSVHPAKLVGASMALVYEQDSRKISLFLANSPQGLSVKGRSIIGHDESKSFAKLLRKPVEQIPDIMKATKMTVEKRLHDIKSVQGGARHRSYENTTILKVW